MTRATIWPRVASVLQSFCVLELPAMAYELEFRKIILLEENI
jgi:hypothetical protein